MAVETAFEGSFPVRVARVDEDTSLRDDLQLLLESVVDHAIFTVDPNGLVASWNRGAERIKGYEARDILGRHVSCFYPANDVANGIPEHALRIAEDMGSFESEGWRVRKDGSLFWARVVITAFRSPDGSLRGFGKVTRDLTREKRAEETARELVRVQAEARAVELRDEFLSIAGHELRTPHTALHIQLQSLEAAFSNGTVMQNIHRWSDRLKRTVQSSKRLERLVHEMVDVSRLATGRLALEAENTDLVSIVSQVVDRKRGESSRVGSPISFSHHGRTNGQWDRERLEQVVDSLVSNALKYGPGMPINIRVNGGHERVTLAVQDHGIGVAEEHQARIFGRFERAVSDRNYGGLGLGLWKVREIVSAHGGEIRVESEPNAGATFTLEIPFSGRA